MKIAMLPERPFFNKPQSQADFAFTATYPYKQCCCSDREVSWEALMCGCISTR